MIETTDSTTDDASTDAFVADGAKEQSRHALLVRVYGYVFVLLFIGMTATYRGFDIRYYPPMDSSSPGEMNLWLAYVFLLLPGCCLLGLGYSTSLYRLLRRTFARLEAMTHREAVVAAAALGVVAFAFARLGNALVLLGYPITDDEYAAQFGGRILASGHVAVPMPDFLAVVPVLFTHLQNGMLAAADFVGVQAAWAFSEITGTGPLLWSVASAVTVVAVAAAVARRLGYGWAAVAASMFVLSPMAISLSFTTHAHVLSRCFVAVAYLFYVVADRSGRLRDWTVVGLAIGLAFIVRPAETAFIFLPLGILLLVETARGERNARIGLLGIAAGVVGPLVVFALHNAAVTGKFWLPARFSPNMINDAIYVPGDPIQPQVGIADTTLWERFGTDTAFNALELGIWYLGPIGVALSLVGFSTNKLTKLAGAGVLSVLALGLFHANTGIHIVGPIHYSECAVLCTILAVHGCERIVRRLAALRVGLRETTSAVAMSLVVGLGLCNGVNFLALWKQANIQQVVYERLDRTIPEGKAVVIVPHFARIWNEEDGLGSSGTWVFVWRRPYPDFRDRLLLFQGDKVPVDVLRQNFPDRPIFLLRMPRDGGPFELEQIP
jgi:hypothetical protein